MIYLDYSSNTPMSLEALNAYNSTAKEYIGNISANNKAGLEAKQKLLDTTKEIGAMLNVMPSEIIYTTGATEANNMALIGVALAKSKTGKHIIVSKLEHPSIYKICDYLKSIGFEISYVDNDEEGLINFENLKKLIRNDTILVSICAVNSETGVRQPLKMLRQIIKKENDKIVFHSDLSCAIGKTAISFRDIDIGSVSSHKIYGPSGIGFLYKNSNVLITPLIYGNKNNEYKPGMPSLPLIVSMAEALKHALKDLDKKERYVNLLNDRIISKIENLEGIQINKSKNAIPHIINFSLNKIPSEALITNLSNNDIIISGNNKDEISSPVMAMYNDLDRSKRTICISLSHLTSVLEINRFLEVFEVEYNNLLNLYGK